MVRNSMGGKKAKKMKNSGPVKRATIFPNEDQFYAVIDKCHSHSNIEICYINEDDIGNSKLTIGIGVLRGKIIKRIKKINPGDLLIVSKRDFETVKVGAKPKLDIIHKYNDNERSFIIQQVPSDLRSYIDTQFSRLDASKDTSLDIENEIMFQDDGSKYERHKSKNNFHNNVVTTDYLAGFDLPDQSDDEDNMNE
jgi:hypothetical protein